MRKLVLLALVAGVSACATTPATHTCPDGSVINAAVPCPPPPPPPPPPPATMTCPDGTVVNVGTPCPAPPPPPPPPPPPARAGERGWRQRGPAL